MSPPPAFYVLARDCGDNIPVRFFHFVKNVQQVALEAGNSPAIIFKHYRELTTEEQARQWFGILPPSA